MARNEIVLEHKSHFFSKQRHLMFKAGLNHSKENHSRAINSANVLQLFENHVYDLQQKPSCLVPYGRQS